jgi:hypothetical protein
LRGKHINASWQINLIMGCKNLEKEMSSSKNKIVYSINGSKEETNFKKD